MDERAILESRVLVLDDQASALALMRAVLKHAGFGNGTFTSDPREAVQLFQREPYDAVMLDLHIAGTDGINVMAAIRESIDPEDFVPILVITGDTEIDSRQRALEAGATDFVLKPVNVVDLGLRLRNVLATRQLHQELRERASVLEQRVRLRTISLERAQFDTARRLAIAAEFRDDQTGQHTLRVGEMSRDLAVRTGCADPLVDLIGHAAPLHDIGKIGVPDHVLLKHGALDLEERRMMERHTTIGHQILAGSVSPLLQLAADIALNHHERWDGAGYPEGLSGEAIPLAARIVAVADVYDALLHERPYKEPWSAAHTLDEMISLSGRAFDPHIVDALVAAHREGTLPSVAGIELRRSLAT
ncbi:MAG: HD domain-containing phosphohydrolase [Candidatus Dormibacteria bacterium]